MKISYNWLKDFIKTDLSVEKMAEILTDIGLEVEGTEKTGITQEDLENFVVGEVVSCEKHPNADKLKVTQVDLGSGQISQIVCGAPNVTKGQKVPVATPGAVIKDGKGNEFKIKKAKLRGEASNGMICSKKELRLSEDHAGIWEMDETLTAGTPLCQVINTETDAVFEIGLTPNRADAMSHFGVARDVLAALKSRNLPVEKLDNNIPKIEETQDENPISVTIADTELCQRYAGIYMTNVEIKPSPEWLQKRLRAIGLSPLNNVVDITNYVLHTYGQPMHAFDADKISGNQIIVKKSEAKQKFTTLDNVERELNGEELMICDKEKAVGIAGVMGGLDSSVTENTKNIFLESAYFQPVSVRKTSKFHAINSDASFRFERGIDPNFTVKALAYAVHLVKELAGGEIVGKTIDLYPTPIAHHEAILHYRKVDKLLGERLHREKIKDILKSLEIEIISETPDLMELEIPAYRVDVQREADLIEEILRIYGFNNIPNKEKISTSIVLGEGFADEKIENTLAEMLVSQGFHEAMNLSMYKAEYNDWLNFNTENSVKLLNSLSSDLSTMRRSLLPGLLENIDYNIKRKQETIKLFEFGQSYQKTDKGFHEKRTLAMVISGKWHKEHWENQQENVQFSHVKGLVNQLFLKFKLQNLTLASQAKSYEDLALNYMLDEKELVHISQISNQILKKFDIGQDVFYAEIDITLWKEFFHKNKGTKFQELPKFPSVRRDLALLLDKTITYQEIQKIVLNSDKQFIKNVNLFDVYEGDKLPQGKKSYAVSITLQDNVKTMKDKQIDSIVSKVVKSLKKELNAELRT